MENEIEKQNNQILTDAVVWLRAEIEKNQYSDIGINFSVHGGRLTKTAKTITQKIQTLTGGCN